ncbi:MAG: WYL domain-containing protein [bacterium]|nr:WYL domain-containing protein [bacterium]
MINNYINLIPYILQKNSFTIKGIAEELNVSPNVIKRIVNTLSQQFGINFIYDKKTKKYILADREILNLLNENSIELEDILLYILCSAISYSQDLKIKRKSLLFYYFITNNKKYSQKIANKSYILGEYVKDFRKDILFTDVPIDFNIFTKIRDAITNKKELRVLVNYFGIVTYINLIPLYLAFLKGEWFLIYASFEFSDNLDVNNLQQNEERIEEKIQDEIKKVLTVSSDLLDKNLTSSEGIKKNFENNLYKIDFIKVSDIKEIFYTGKIIDYSIDSFIEDALPELAFYFKPLTKYKVKIEFNNIFIYDILKVWHPSQHLEIINNETMNSKIILTLEVSNLNNLFMWLSSFGKNAKITEPELVKAKYIEYLNSIIDFNKD